MTHTPRSFTVLLNYIKQPGKICRTYKKSSAKKCVGLAAFGISRHLQVGGVGGVVISSKQVGSSVLHFQSFLMMYPVWRFFHSTLKKFFLHFSNFIVFIRSGEKTKIPERGHMIKSKMLNHAI